MTIDEAIAHAREKAKEKRKEMQCKTCKLFARSDLHPLQGYCRKNEFRSIEIDSWSKVCSEYVPKEMCKYAEEHEQIAEWLEELKDYRDKNKMVVRVDVENMDSIKDKIEELSKYAESQYNKAIDDLTEKIIRYVDCGHLCSPTEIRWSDLSVVEMVKKLAEQLKAGGNDEMEK